MTTLIKNPTEAELVQFVFLLGAGYAESPYNLLDIKVERLEEVESDYTEDKLIAILKHSDNGHVYWLDCTEEFNEMIKWESRK